MPEPRAARPATNVQPAHNSKKLKLPDQLPLPDIKPEITPPATPRSPPLREISPDEPGSEPKRAAEHRFPPKTGAGTRQCTNCGETDTPQWRGTLCNACALWKRSRGTDRPMPLLFPERRHSRSLSPDDDDDSAPEELHASPRGGMAHADRPQAIFSSKCKSCDHADIPLDDEVKPSSCLFGPLNDATAPHVSAWLGTPAPVMAARPSPLLSRLTPNHPLQSVFNHDTPTVSSADLHKQDIPNVPRTGTSPGRYQSYSSPQVPFESRRGVVISSGSEQGIDLLCETGSSHGQSGSGNVATQGSRPNGHAVQEGYFRPLKGRKGQEELPPGYNEFVLGARKLWSALESTARLIERLEAQERVNYAGNSG